MHKTISRRARHAKQLKGMVDVVDTQEAGVDVLVLVVLSKGKLLSGLFLV